MINDLLGKGSISGDADIVVVGAGTAGLVVAVELARKGFSVICLESGGWQQDTEEHPLNEVVHTKSKYSGAAHGRFRCLGGTSTRWGGALIPFMASDVENADWPISYDDIHKYCKAVENLFGLSSGSYELGDMLRGEKFSHVARLAKWPPFKKRNVFNLLSTEARAENGPVIWLNATVTDFRVEGKRLTSIVAQAPDKSTISVGARRVIFAAGAIETTRLLLLLDQQNNGCISLFYNQLGRNFHDHHSVMVAELAVNDRKMFNRLVGFRFEKNGAMRNLRFELAEDSPVRYSVPPCFAHITFLSRTVGGFDALRDLYRYAQQRRIAPISTFLSLAAATPWLLRAAWWRFVEKRLLYPDQASIQVHMVVEQVPRPENYISLSATKIDMYGKPLAQIEWSIYEEDVVNLSKAVDAFENVWNTSELSAIAKFIRRPKGEAEAEMARGGGIYHPGGSTRMGASANEGVVDKDLRLFSLPNVRIVSTSVLPTGGGANPTMMLMMLALRCVDQVAEDLTAQANGV